MSLFKKLGLIVKEPSEPEETETLRKIIAKLDGLEPRVARFHALFAFVLSRVANVDSHISPEETRRMEEVLIKLGHVGSDLALLVVEIAKAQNQLLGGIENYLFTRDFAAIATREEREHLLECLFAVASADESISTQENAEIRKISDELGFTHREYIDIRSLFREHLSVLQNLPTA